MVAMEYRGCKVNEEMKAEVTHFLKEEMSKEEYVRFKAALENKDKDKRAMWRYFVSIEEQRYMNTDNNEVVKEILCYLVKKARELTF